MTATGHIQDEDEIKDAIRNQFPNSLSDEFSIDDIRVEKQIGSDDEYYLNAIIALRGVKSGDRLEEQIKSRAEEFMGFHRAVISAAVEAGIGPFLMISYEIDAGHAI